MRRAVTLVQLFAAGALAGCAGLTASLRDHAPQAPPVARAAAASPAPQSPDRWPREIPLANARFRIDAPQIESWKGDELVLRFAVASLPAGSSDAITGVIWASARMQVDRGAGLVGLADFRLTHGAFPSLPDSGASLLAQVQDRLPEALRTLSFARVVASLAASDAWQLRPVDVRHAAPVVFVSHAPAILVAIAGRPVWQRVPGTHFERVLNTRAVILRDAQDRRCYLRLADGWLTASSVLGPWGPAASQPEGIDEVARDLARQVEADGSVGSGEPPPALAHGAPAVFVSQVPAELVVFAGRPEFEPIASTRLRRARNTDADVIVDTDDDAFYVLLAGRWFSAPSLSGPWSHVASTQLPGDFSKIPPESPAGRVLAAVAGTPQAREALIGNSLPQTATVPLASGPTFSPRYDGPPQLAAVPGTPLQFVINSQTPTIRVDASAWYAVRAGVWFFAASVNGPFTITTLVPASIYAIPASSPLHIVTHVQILGSTANEVRVGYMPGYLGTAATPEGVVVYGTGFAYAPWVGSAYFAPPPTFGVMARPIADPALGWSYRFARELTSAAMPAAWQAPASPGAATHVPSCCDSTLANVYATWGDRVASGLGEPH